jgi:hypothetical protein
LFLANSLQIHRCMFFLGGYVKRIAGGERENMDKDSPFVGRWTYRSFRNDPELSKAFNDLRFGAGTLVLDEPDYGRLSGSLGDEGWSLSLVGGYTYGNPFALRFQGSGEIGGERWVYDYVGYLVPIWPNGVDQRAAIVGSVIRTVPHNNGQATAGYVASFIAVKQVQG